MKSYRVGAILFVLFLVFIISMIDFGKRPDIYVFEIRKEYRGVVEEKILKRSTILKIRTDGDETIEVGILCNELTENVEVGDRIEKIRNEIYVLLRKDTTVLKLKYLYISEKIRSDRRWPKEWKDTWPESTY
ncbi:MAG: hypothetical protein QM762_09750 [Chryseolinea sp.]